MVIDGRGDEKEARRTSRATTNNDDFVRSINGVHFSNRRSYTSRYC